MRYYPHYDPQFERILDAEQRRLLRELSAQKMSWRKIGNVIKLRNLMRVRDR